MQLSRRTTLAMLAATAWPHAARAGAAPAEVAAELPGAQLHGSGRLRFFGLHIYDARLWTTGRLLPADWARAPIALELQYARSLVGRQIAERSLQEMKRQGAIDAAKAGRWLDAMSSIFPDVRDGDRITGVRRVDESARFFVNGQLKGEVLDTEFAQRFFGIWLAPQSSQPRLREALLGLARSGDPQGRS